MSLITEEMKAAKKLEFESKWSIFIYSLKSEFFGEIEENGDVESIVNNKFTKYRHQCFSGGEEDVDGECISSSQFNFEVEELQKLRNCGPCKVVYAVVNKIPTTALLHVHSTVIGHNKDLSRQCALDQKCRVCLKDYCSLRDGHRSYGSISHISFIDPLDDGWQRVGVATLQKIAAEKWQLNGHLKTIKGAWSSFNNLFKFTSSYINVNTVMKQHYYETIMKHYSTTSHLELRVMVGKGGEMFDEEGNALSAAETIQVYYDTMKQIQNERQFSMVIIPCSRRASPIETIMEAYDVAHDLSLQYPEFINGFDLLGQETKESDINVREFFLKYQNMPRERQLPLVMHMGERTYQLDNFYIEMLQSHVYRIGHGLALTLHNLRKN